MAYNLSVATEEARDLVVTALRTAADQRTRVALGAARKVAAAKTEGLDVRSRSVKVTALLAEAGDLEALADELAAATDVPLVTPAVAGADLPGAAVAVEVTEAAAALGVDPAAVAAATDDGTSPAAQAAAALGGLTPYDPDEPEDPLTGATSEDAATDPEQVLP